VLGYIALICNIIRTIIAVTLERFLAFPQNLVFGFALLVLVSFTFLGFTKILWMVVFNIHLFFTL
jgi:hypothetical protein